jgi:hypothetical protein
MDAPSDRDPLIEDRDGHGRFRDICLVYGDFHRDVFLQEFLRWFVRNANEAELVTLRKAVAERATRVSKGRKRGRPRAEDDADWLVKVKTSAWRHIVEGWTWKQIAESEGMRPTKANTRTISRRVDQYAGIIWEACSEAGIWEAGADTDTRLAQLKSELATNKFKQLLWIRAGLPFGIFPQKDLTEGCTKIVLTLALRGGNAVAKELVRRMNYRKSKKRK